MIEDAGTPRMFILNDWFIEAGYIYGLTDEIPRRYISARLDSRTDEHRIERGGRAYAVGDITFVLSRPLGQLQ